MSAMVYASCAGAGVLHALQLDASAARLRPQQALALGGQLMPMAIQPGGRQLVVARRSEPMAAVSLDIQAHTGWLSPAGATALPASMPYITFDATGRWLLAASYQGGVVAVCGVGEDGQIQPAHQVLASGPKTHSISTTPDQQQVLACVLGSDQFLRYAWDAERGQLADPQALNLPAGSGPRHFVLRADGQQAWVLGELDGSICTVQLTGPTMQLLHHTSALPAGFAGTPWAADVRLHPTQRSLYASERTSSTLALLHLAQDGTPNLQGHWPAPEQPRGFAISADGHWLVCAGQLSGTVRLYHIDPATGTLEATDEQSVDADPNWVEVLELPSNP